MEKLVAPGKIVDMEEKKRNFYAEFINGIKGWYKDRNQHDVLLCKILTILQKSRAHFNNSVRMNADTTRFQRVVFVTNEVSAMTASQKGKEAWNDEGKF